MIVPMHVIIENESHRICSRRVSLLVPRWFTILLAQTTVFRGQPIFSVSTRCLNHLKCS